MEDHSGRQPGATATFGPIGAGERIEAVDVLRGFALLGILVINIMGFALPFRAMEMPQAAGGHTGLDLWTWFFSNVLFYQKFMGLFSMLFGAGVILMTQRAEGKGFNFAKTYYRRLGWLFLLGLIHAYLIWWGDILFFYAVCGLLLYPIRKKGAKFLIILGSIAFMFAALFFIGMGFFFGYVKAQAAEAQALVEQGEELTSLQQEWMDIWNVLEREVFGFEQQSIREIKAHRGGFWDIVGFRWQFVLQLHTVIFVAFIFWQIIGQMLIGMGLAKAGVITGDKPRRFYLWMFVVCYGIGLPLAIIKAGSYMQSGFDPFHLWGAWSLFDRITVPALVLGNIGLLLWLLKGGHLARLTRALAAVGRMALTNYIMHTVVFVLIFNGYGLGLYGKISRFGLIWFVFGMWILQSIVSPIWLRHYRFGPLEWLWRSLTYKRLQQIRAGIQSS